jgi:hypothetical protein
VGHGHGAGGRGRGVDSLEDPGAGLERRGPQGGEAGADHGVHRR